jgi:hypothetical protein
MKTYDIDDFPLGTPTKSDKLSPLLREHLAIDEANGLSFFITKARVSSVEVYTYKEADSQAVRLNDRPVSWGAIGVKGRENHSRREGARLRAMSPWRTDIRLKINLKKGEGRALIEAKLPIKWNVEITPGEVVDLVAAQGNEKAVLISAVAPNSSLVIPLSSVPVFVSPSNRDDEDILIEDAPAEELVKTTFEGMAEGEEARHEYLGQSDEGELPKAPSEFAFTFGVFISLVGAALIFGEVYFPGLFLLIFGTLGLAQHSRDKAEYKFALSRRDRTLQKRRAEALAQVVTADLGSTEKMERIERVVAADAKAQDD